MAGDPLICEGAGKWQPPQMPQSRERGLKGGLTESSFTESSERSVTSPRPLKSLVVVPLLPGTMLRPGEVRQLA